MKIIGTPPTRTPELYEKYLPYAMALGLESEWTTQFTPLFEELTKNNRPYKPAWYHGNNWTPFFARNIQKSLHTASQRPGSSSGRSGSGSSGGGGGGGGGRGW